MLLSVIAKSRSVCIMWYRLIPFSSKVKLNIITTSESTKVKHFFFNLYDLIADKCHWNNIYVTSNSIKIIMFNAVEIVHPSLKNWCKCLTGYLWKGDYMSTVCDNTFKHFEIKLQWLSTFRNWKLAKRMNRNELVLIIGLNLPRMFHPHTQLQLQPSQNIER